MTFGFLSCFLKLFDFNPHSHAGSDLSLLQTLNFYFDFNPHSHAGSDVIATNLVFLFLYFNPHSHAGSDHGSIVKSSITKISIHTPTQGVTWKMKITPYVQYISIHTPTQGVTHCFPGLNEYIHISIHTPTQGVTAWREILQNSSCDFNPHSHAGSDSPIKLTLVFALFQSTLPRRE